jgi:hypothetical protein
VATCAWAKVFRRDVRPQQNDIILLFKDRSVNEPFGLLNLKGFFIGAEDKGAELPLSLYYYVNKSLNKRLYDE